MNKKIVALICGGVILLACAACFLFSALFRAPVIAFYDLDAPTQSAIKNELGDRFSYVTFDTQTSLSYQVSKSKAKALFTRGTAAVAFAKELQNKKARLPFAALGNMTTSIRTLSAPDTDGLTSSLPLLTDHLEVNIDERLIRTTKTKLPNAPSWNDLAKFAAAASQKQGNPRVMFAGKESAALLDILGALAESLDGRDSYNRAIALIQEEYLSAAKKISITDLADRLAASPSSPLFSAAQMLSQWYSQGLLYRDVFNLTSENLKSLMEMDLASIVIMPLSVHRTIGQQTIQNYVSIYFPSYNPASKRFFTAPVVYGVPLSSIKKVNLALLSLSEVSSQEQMARTSGLAPVLAQCRTPDRQADNVRYWVAASNTPLCGLSRETALTTRERDELAAALKTLILHPKN